MSWEVWRKDCQDEKEETLEKAAKRCKAATGVGCDGFHTKVPLDLSKRAKGEVVEILGKVERCERWPQQACTTNSSCNRRLSRLSGPLRFCPP